MADDFGFDWDRQNQSHLKSHHVSPQEFEQVIRNDPFDLEYQVETGEERFKSLGVTDTGRVLIVVWALREDKVRAVTAYPGGKSYEKLYRDLRRGISQ